MSLTKEKQELLQALEQQHEVLKLSVLAAFERLEPNHGVFEMDISPSSQPIEPNVDSMPEDRLDFEATEMKMEAVLSWSSSEASYEPYSAASITLPPTPERLPKSSSILQFKQMISKTNRYIDAIAGVLVFLNGLLMLVELELEGQALGATLGLHDGFGMNLAEVEPIFQVLDNVFVYIFLVELLVRIAAEGKAFCRELANWFDALLVVAGLLDVLIIAPSSRVDPQNIILWRLFRVIKGLRALRMVRSLHLFRGLNLLVKACYCFLPSLAWSMVLLGLLMSTGSLIIGNLLRGFIENGANDMDDRVWIWTRYGTAYRTLYTIYEVTFAGNWPTNARPVLDKVSHWFVIFFVAYVTLIVFAVIRVISAVFLKDTLEAAQNDAEALVLDRLKKKAVYVRKLEMMFKAINSSCDGMVTQEKLAAVLANPAVTAYFQTLDIDVLDSGALFHLLDNGDGEMSMTEFIEGILRCKGPARAIDQVAMRSEIARLDRRLVKLSHKLKDAGVIKGHSHTKRAK